jgi:hypothetical protein
VQLINISRLLRAAVPRVSEEWNDHLVNDADDHGVRHERALKEEVVAQHRRPGPESNRCDGVRADLATFHGAAGNFFESPATDLV